MKHMLADYPAYEAPYSRNIIYLPIEQAEANVRYFFDQKPLRLSYLSDFMSRFGVTTAIDDAGVEAVSAWFPDYAGLLVNRRRLRDEMSALFDFAFPWTGDFYGLNAIFDLGIYFGECTIARNPRLRWNIVDKRFIDCVARGGPPAVPNSNLIGEVGTFGIKGTESGWGAFDPIDLVYSRCLNISLAYEFNLSAGMRGTLDRKPDGFTRDVLDYATR